jgi:hypothetical protein
MLSLRQHSLSRRLSFEWTALPAEQTTALILHCSRRPCLLCLALHAVVSSTNAPRIMSGLQRRRVGHASESSVGGAQAGTFTMDPDSSSPTNGDAHRGHGGSALEGGGRVAYDPRDLEFSNEAKEGGKMPRLTIMEEVLLLGLKDRAVSV